MNGKRTLMNHDKSLRGGDATNCSSGGTRSDVQLNTSTGLSIGHIYTYLKHRVYNGSRREATRSEGFCYELHLNEAVKGHDMASISHELNAAPMPFHRQRYLLDET